MRTSLVIRTLAAAGVALFVALAPSLVPAADGVTLLVDRGPSPGDLTLDWTGGQPIFEVYSSTDPSTVVMPANSLGTTNGNTFTTAEGPEPLLFLLVTSPCVVEGPEYCDGYDNDCNGEIDEGNVETTCELPNATAACEDGTCVVDFCDVGFVDCDSLDWTGCEYFAENLEQDPYNCGTCNFVCPDPANAAPECVGGDCGYICDAGFWDCNADGLDGCEISDADLLTDSENCGSCGDTCALPNGVGVCSDGQCLSEVATCDPNYYDLNQNGDDGCEYFCVFQSPNDTPDDSFVDANCDGIDGNAATAIFVSLTGSNVNPGTIDLPVQTVTVGLARAQSLSRTEVYVDQGVYMEQVNLINGISIYGGYSRAAGWARSAIFTSEIRNNAVVAGSLTAVSCAGATMPTRLDRLRITTTNAGSTGVTNYAVRTSGCSGLTIHASVVIAGNGSAGMAGTVGPTAAAGGFGGAGFPGSCDGAHGNGGTAGVSTCGRAGGAGGRGGLTGNNAGVAGSPGVGPTPGGNGGAGGDPGQPGSNGVNGAAGGTGSHGAGGSGGGVVGALWAGNNGGNGGPGSPGNGGGGGGGGGGQGCTFCDDGGGNGGGGGGAGGCAGTGATAGLAGGGSFGVFLVNSNGATISSSFIQSGNGGAGGFALSGANGGAGGPSGPGATVCSPNEVGRGGNGGTGGAGGAGGSGGGGAGGPSYSVYRFLSVITLTGNTLVAGLGGPGGVAPVNSGTAGSSGTLF